MSHDGGGYSGGHHGGFGGGHHGHANGGHHHHHGGDGLLPGVPPVSGRSTGRRRDVPAVVAAIAVLAVIAFVLLIAHS